MTEADLDTITDALALATESDNRDLANRAERVRKQLNVVSWELDVWKGGELYDGTHSTSPSQVLQWAVSYGDWDTPIADDADAVTAFETIQHEWEEMDISFTILRKFRGDILLWEDEHSEDELIRAAKAEQKDAA